MLQARDTAVSKTNKVPAFMELVFSPHMLGEGGISSSAAK